MPRSVYEKVKEFPMPMPIPKPKGMGEEVADLAYMSFAEAQLLQFTGEHQPSLAASRLRKDATTKKKQAHERAELGSTRVVHTISQS